MKRRFTAIFLVVLFASTMALSQKLEDVLKKYYEARGGLKNIKAVQTIQFNGKMSMMGKDFPLTIYQKRNGGYRSDMTMGKSNIVQAYDGKNGWQIIPMTGSPDPIDMSPAELRGLKEEADFEGCLINSQEKGYQVELIGKEKLNDTDVYHIKVVRKDTTEIQIFLDAKSYREIKRSEKVNMQGKEIEVMTKLSDYKKVGKLMLPFTQEVSGGMPQKVQLEKIEFNKPLPDSIFVKPVKK